MSETLSGLFIRYLQYIIAQVLFLPIVFSMGILSDFYNA